MAKSDGRDYFKRTSTFWIITVALSMGYFTCVVLAPEKVPFGSLGPLGTLSTYLVANHSGLMYNVWVGACVGHLFEATVALVLCSRKGIDDVATRCLWFVQTLLFGFASLSLLFKYNPERPKVQ
ncbi:transmembrane protein 254 [Diretmus argenteus]